MKKTSLTFLAVYFTFTFAFPQSWQKIQFVPVSEYSNGLLECKLWGDTGIVAGSYGKIFHSNDFFQTFTVDTTYHTHSFDAVSFANRDTGYITSCTVQGGMLKTTDGGNTWYGLPFNPACIGEDLFFTSPDTGYSSLHQYAHRFIFTFNGGQNWYENNIPTGGSNIGVTKIEKVRDSLLYISCVDGQGSVCVLTIYRTADYGVHWQNTYNSIWPITQSCDFHFIDDTTLILATNGAILKSKDAGFSFDTVMYNGWYDIVSDNVRAISFVDRDTGFVAFMDKVYKTFDAGDTWLRTDFSFDSIDQANANEITFIKAVSSQKVVLGCFRGNIYKTETGGGIWSGIKNVEGENSIILYPNPASNNLILALTTTTGKFNYQILSIEGKTLTDVIPVTQTNTEIDISTFPAGLYFLQLQDEKTRAVKKFIKE